MTETDAGDRPGTPEQYDREAAWSRFVAACAKCQTWPEGKTVFFRELDAAVVWATRREREVCVDRLREIAHIERIPTHLTSRQVINLVADALDESGLIRSDPDTPAQENSK
jgi:hypothetical protein